MNISKMGFKHTMLQRLNNFDTMPGQTSPSLASEESQASPNSATITDFSINRILADDNKVKSHYNSSKTKTKSTTRQMPGMAIRTTTTAPATKATIDILDLSKTRGHSTATATTPLPATLTTTSPRLPTMPETNTLNNYHLMHADFIAATKFYAQFLPHMFPAYNFPAAPISTTPTATPTAGYQKYFAPYILNNATALPATAMARHPAQQQNYFNTKHSIPLQCQRLDCFECTDYYKKLPLKPKPITPTTYQHMKQQYSKAKTTTTTTTEFLSNSSTMKLTATTTNIEPAACNNAINSTATSAAEEISYKCRICDKVFGCLQTLQAHEKTHKSPRYECTDCGKGFSQLRNYKYHISVHRGTKEFAAECPECGKTFNDKGYLSSHMKIHRNKKEYECPYCPKSFNQRVAFNMHVRIHTGVKPHKCAECGKRFSRKMLLKQHMRTHSGEKPYQCSVCGKSFADRSNMTLHHRLHSGIKPFSCPICPKAFTKKHHLKTHLNYHTGCKPYVCPHPNCNQAFTQSSNMRTHAKKCQYRPLEYPAFAEDTKLNSCGNTASTLTNNSTMRMDNLNVLNARRLAMSTRSSNIVAAAGSDDLRGVLSTASMLTVVNSLPTTHSQSFPFVQQQQQQETLMSTTLRPY